MGLNKKYDGYKSFQYLEEGIDYKEFEMPDSLYWGEPYEVPVTDEEEEKVKKLAKENIYISLHDHAFYLPKNVEETFDYTADCRIRTAYEGLAKSYYDAVFDNLLNGLSTVTSKMGWKWNDVIYDLGMRLSDIAHQDFVIRGETVDDIRRAYDEGKVAFVPVLETCTPIENEIDRLDILYGLGVRMMGIVYSEANSLASGLKEDRDAGLTYFGRAAVDRMNKLGMAMDVSHASDQTCLDTFEASDKPVFLTHTGSRELWDTKRLRPDEVLQACAETGGVIGVTAAPHITLSEEHPVHTIESVMDHFEYIVDLVGIDHVTFGVDAIYGNHVDLHHVFQKQFSLDEVYSTDEEEEEEKEEEEEAPEVDHVKGMENLTEASHNILRWLVKNGYSDKEIKKVMSGNVLRALEEIW